MTCMCNQMLDDRKGVLLYGIRSGRPGPCFLKVRRFLGIYNIKGTSCTNMRLSHVKTMHRPLILAICRSFILKNMARFDRFPYTDIR